MSVSAAEFREALSRWASGVTVVACRYEGRVVATTVSAFASLSLDPPLVLVALSPNATVLPFLGAGASFSVSVLAGHHRRLATVFADPFPVGPSPFDDADPPIINDALLGLACTVDSTMTGGDHVLVFAAVSRISGLSDDPPLVRFRRRYHTLPGDGPAST